MSTFMRPLTFEGGDLLSQIDINNKRVTEDNILSKSLEKILINDHVDAIKGRMNGHKSLEHIFGFCRTFKKFTINLGFHLTIKTANLQNIILV